MTTCEKFRIECLDNLIESIKKWDIHHDDNSELSKEEGYLLWTLEKSISDLKEFYEKEKVTSYFK